MIKSGWKNKGGTSELPQCGCGTWKQHWINVSGKKWPTKCAVDGCTNSAEVGAHICNPEVQGVQIAPFCKECNAQETSFEFSLKDNVELVSANRAKTCVALLTSKRLYVENTDSQCNAKALGTENGHSG
jgi:hypothetical protein